MPLAPNLQKALKQLPDLTGAATHAGSQSASRVDIGLRGLNVKLLLDGIKTELTNTGITPAQFNPDII